MSAKELITPESAVAYRARNGANRGFSQLYADHLAGEMAAGRWVPLASTIKIRLDGSIGDGQHRLAAVAQSGLAQEFYIEENVTDDVLTVTDTGRRRSLGDVIGWRYGERNAKVIAAVVRFLLNWESAGEQVVGGTGGSGRAISLQVGLAYYLSHTEELRLAAHSAVGHKGNAPLSQRVTGAMFLLLSRADGDDAESFFRRPRRACTLSVGP